MTNLLYRFSPFLYSSAIRRRHSPRITAFRELYPSVFIEESTMDRISCSVVSNSFAAMSRSCDRATSDSRLWIRPSSILKSRRLRSLTLSKNITGWDSYNQVLRLTRRIVKSTRGRYICVRLLED